MLEFGNFTVLLGYIITVPVALFTSKMVCIFQKSDLSLLTDILRTMKFDIPYCVT
jgi:hypothetical protein